MRKERSASANRVVTAISWVAVTIIAFLIVVPHLAVINGKQTTMIATKQATATPPIPIIASTSTLVVIPTATATSAGPTYSDQAVRVVARTNSYRQQFGCAPLKLNPQLTQAAQGHSQDMATSGVRSHDSSKGVSPAQRIIAAGYHYSDWAENIAWSQATPEAAVDAWFNETPPNDGHRRNILNCKLQEIGVGYYFDATDPSHLDYYWTQDFGRPAGA